jgi:hypothetical protein
MNKQVSVSTKGETPSDVVTHSIEASSATDALNERQQLMLDVMIPMNGETHLDMYFSADISNHRLCAEARSAEVELPPEHRARFMVRVARDDKFKITIYKARR